MGDEQRLISISAVLVAGTLTLAELEENDRMPTTRQWIGLAIAYTLGAMASDLGLGGIGGGLALLLLVSVLLTRGDDVLRYLGVRLGGGLRKGRRRARRRVSAAVDAVPRSPWEIPELR